MYDKVIMPYKGLLEEWYVEHRSFRIDVLLVFLTIWVVLFPGSRLVWRLFPDLPARPKALEPYL